MMLAWSDPTSLLGLLLSTMFAAAKPPVLRQA